jgi:hypothetical protein
MTTIQNFIQNGGFVSQEGGLNIPISKFFENFIVTESGIFDKKTYNFITMNNTIDKKIVNDSIIINDVISQKFNLGIDRILYGETETIEDIYKITIKYLDFKKNINIESKESMEKICNNYGLIISFLHENFNLSKGEQIMLNKAPLSVKVSA